MINKYLVIDFETANSKRYSACQIGITIINSETLEITDSFGYYINPEVSFTQNCMNVHGITPRTVENALTFPQFWEEFQHLFDFSTIVAHNAVFDMSVLRSTAVRYGITLPNLDYICTYEMAKQKYQASSYKLNYLCEKLNIELEVHHDALADSLACAKLFLHMIKNTTGPQILDVVYDDVIKPVSTIKRKFFAPPEYADITLDFYDIKTLSEIMGKNIVVTGDFEGFTRAELQNLIEKFGGIFNKTITKKTDFVAIGMQNLNVVVDAHNAKSRKIIRAEELISKGANIKFVKITKLVELFENEKTNL